MFRGMTVHGIVPCDNIRWEAGGTTPQDMTSNNGGRSADLIEWLEVVNWNLESEFSLESRFTCPVVSLSFSSTSVEFP